MSLTRYALWLFILTLTGYLMIVGKNLLQPLVLAVVFWYLIDTLAEFYKRFRIGRFHLPRSVALTSAILSFGTLVWLLGTVIGRNVTAVIAAAPGYQERLEKVFLSAADRLGFTDAPTLSQLFNRFDLGSVLSDIAGAAASVAGIIGIVIVYVGFLFVEQINANRKIELLFRDPVRSGRLKTIMAQVSQDIQIYLRIKIMLGLVVALIGYVIMWGVGLHFAGFWAVLIFFFYFIPTIGSLLAILSPVLLTLVQFDSLTPFFIVAVTMGITQISMANIVEPAIMGRSLNLSPFVIILSLMVWGTIWGVIGMFLCVPIMVIVMIVLANFEATRPVAVLLSADGRIFATRPPLQPDALEEKGPVRE
ncbi:MAG: permease [Alphaproteobacteria bacterium]|jgi:predicted PurR-regulated permease PerM|nr:permease [Alphaproteobacteria bacterium]